MAQQTEASAIVGQRGYHVCLTGDYQEDPSYYVRSGSTWDTQPEALAEAEAMLRKLTQELPDAFWNASIDSGSWSLVERYHGIDLLTFDYDDSYDYRPTYVCLDKNGNLVDNT